ncbi:hypothetical protein MLD38_038869 [Melastoma candidum]|uniref:Uncharacterized protein n=1 Tax=Melastoma candidum TaxID=119954 RepID=A0ACB9L0M6_9MYRT|nr:hypothetical protein MLD38_038869 [Melastoma candidum]
MSTMHFTCSSSCFTPYSVSIALKIALPSSTSPEWLQVMRRLMKLALSGFIPQASISSKCFMAWRPCPCNPNPNSIAFQETTSLRGISANMRHDHSRCPHFAYMLVKPFPTQTAM